MAWNLNYAQDLDELLPPGHQAPKLKLGLITSKWLYLIISKIFIILHHPYSCYVYTLYNRFPHSSCTFLLILLFSKFTVYCPAVMITLKARVVKNPSAVYWQNKSKHNWWNPNIIQRKTDLTWLDLTWLDLTWLDLTWLDLTWLDLTWLDQTTHQQQVTTLIHDKEQDNDMATYIKQDWTHDKNQPMSRQNW